MESVILEVVSNVKVGKDVYLMRLEGDLSSINNPGEFVEIKLDNYYLRRPISVCDFSSNHLDLLYKVLGQGTKDMSSYEKGKKLDVIVNLGNGFDVSVSNKPLLVAGGIGIAPMFALAKSFNNKGIKPTLIYGAASESDLVLLDELSKYCDLIVCTDDGSLGYKGNVVSYLKENNVDFDKYYACGPQVMLKYLSLFNGNGYVSLEARMGCGFGACMGCSIMTTSGPKRVCKEGPVFEASEVIY
jgi:dihydroorotate dehydrogenase electron transfer subunit